MYRHVRRNGLVRLELTRLVQHPLVESGQAEPVHEYVMSVHDVGRAAVRESLHQIPFPRRARTIQWRKRDRLRQIQELTVITRCGKRNAAQVKVEVERGVVLPHGRPDGQNWV